MELLIEQCYSKINLIQQKSIQQIQKLQSYFDQCLTELKEKMIEIIQKYKKQLENNIDYYKNIQDHTSSKKYFQNILLSQLMQEIQLFDIDYDEQQQSMRESVLANIINNNEDSTTQQQKQIKEVYSILKNAINLFSQYYQNQISSMNINLVDFYSKSQQNEKDFFYSQDRQHANIILEPNLELIQQYSQQQHGSVSDIQIKFEKKINLQSQFLSHLPSFNQIKCFSILDDNRRAFLCTRKNILLVDLQKSKVIKYSDLQGMTSQLITCIQPLYSSEYEEIEYDELLGISRENQLSNDQNSQFQNIIYTINDCRIQSKQNEISQDPNKSNISHKKLTRKQNLIAISVGSLRSSINICILSLKSLQVLKCLTGHTNTVVKLIQLTQDYETLFSISNDKKIFIWNLEQSKAIQIEDINTEQSIKDVLVVNEKQIAVFNLNGEILLWDIEFTQETPNKFKNLTKKQTIQSFCFCLFIGQSLMISDRFFYRITTEGFISQKYYLEMNDYTNRVLIKQELSHKVIGLNILSVNLDVYAIITYSAQNFFEIYKCEQFQTKQYKFNLHSKNQYTETDLSVQNSIENPRVQFIQLKDNSQKMQIAFALAENISIFEISVK